MHSANERWAPVRGLEGRYEVSDLGCVRSISRVFVRSDGQQASVRGRVLKVGLDTHGYPRLALRGGSGQPPRVFMAVHRAVLFAFAFEDGCEQLHVNHKNGIRHDNRLENLEWCTNAYNRLHSYRVLGRTNPMQGRKGTQNHNATPVTGKCIETGEVRYYGAISCTEADGFKPGDVSNCIAGSQKSHRGWMWRSTAAANVSDWSYRPAAPQRHPKPVIRVAADGSEVLYPSATAARADGFNNVAIGHVLHGRATQHGGYFWRFASEVSTAGGRLYGRGEGA